MKRRVVLKNLFKASGIAFFIGIVNHCTNPTEPIIVEQTTTSDSGDTNTNTSSETTKSLTLSEIAANHGHNSITLTISDIENETVQTYNLGGGHNHPFTPTSAQMSQLKGGTKVSFTATGGHSHTFKLEYV